MNDFRKLFEQTSAVETQNEGISGTFREKFDQAQAMSNAGDINGIMSLVSANISDPEEAQAVAGMTYTLAKTYNQKPIDILKDLDGWAARYTGTTQPRKTAWKQIQDGIVSGWYTDQLGTYGSALMNDQKPEVRQIYLDRIAEIKARMPNSEGDKGNIGVKALASAGNLVGTMIRPLLVNTAVTTLIPAIKLPMVATELAGAVPSIVKTVASKAVSFGTTWAVTADVEAGNIYLDMLDNGVDEDIAKKYARIHGAIAGALEAAPLEFAFTRFPFLKGATQNAWRQLATNTRTKQALVKTLGGILQKNLISAPMQVLAETATEALQEVSSISFERRAALALADEIKDEKLKKMLPEVYNEWRDLYNKEVGDRQALYEGKDYKDYVADRIWDVVVQTALGTSVLGFAGAAGQTISDARYTSTLRKEAQVDPSKAHFIKKHFNDDQFKDIKPADRGEALAQIYNTQHTGETVDTVNPKTIDTDYVPINEGVEDEEQAQASGTPTQPIKRRKDNRLHTQEMIGSEKNPGVIRHSDGSESHTLLLGTTDTSVRKNNRYGHIDYTISADGRSVTIDTVKMKPGYEDLTGEFVTELMRRYPGLEIEWSPEENQKAIKEQLIKNNTENPGKLQMFKREQSDMDRILKTAGFIKSVAPNLTQDEAAVFTEILDEKAKNQGITLDEYITNRLQFKSFEQGIKDNDFSEEEKAQILAGRKKGGFKPMIDATKGIVYVGENGDFSTLGHEVMHYSIISDPEAAKELADSLKEAITKDPKGFRKYLIDHAKIMAGTNILDADRQLDVERIVSEISNLSDDPATWTENQHEIAAVLFETALQEGRTFNPRIQTLMDKIIDFFLRIYRTLKKRSMLNDRIVKAYDQLLVGNPELKAKADAIETENQGTKFQTDVTQDDIAEAERQYAEVVAKYKGTDQWMKAPNGKPTNLTERQWVQVRTPNFIRWFGDWLNDPQNASKVVDENGEPRVVSHMTNNEFDVFDLSRAGSNQGSTLGKGIYTTTIPDAYDYAGGKRMDLFANIKNPLDLSVGMTEEQATQIYDKYFAPYHKDPYNSYRPHVIGELKSPSRYKVFNYLYEAADNGNTTRTKILQEIGFDGVISGDEVVAYQPTQIKSATDNVGTFSQSNPSILFQTDTEYLDAVNSGDMAKAQAMVDARAREMGYNSPKLYHGTQEFGFTEADVTKSEDSISFFATDSIETAWSYSNFGGIRQVGKRTSEDMAQLRKDAWSRYKDAVNRFIDLIKELDPEDFAKADVNDIIDADLSKIEKFNDDEWHDFFREVPSRISDMFDKASDNLRWNDFAGNFYYTDEYKRYDDIVTDVYEALRTLEGDAYNYGKGNYALYAKTDNLLEIDANGEKWNGIELPKTVQDALWGHDGFEKYSNPRVFETVNVDTRELAQIAKELGYSGVQIKNVIDDGGHGKTVKTPATVYIFFNPQSQVKSADPVTYDEAGNVIPLSERFNEQNPSLLFQSIGEQGAEALDKAEESTYRMDNLALARELEADNKNAKTIRFITGWERGKDKKWRYEIDDIKVTNTLIYSKMRELNKQYKEADREEERLQRIRFRALPKDATKEQKAQRKADEKAWKEAYNRLQDIKNEFEELQESLFHFEGTLAELFGDNAEVLKAYPTLGDVKIAQKLDAPENVGAYNSETKTITLNRAYDINRKFSTLVHEIQHAIQDIEGFAKGGNEEVAKQLLENKNKEIQTLLDKADAWEWKLELEATEKEHPELAGTVDLLNALVKEYEGFPSWMPSEDVRAKGFNLYVRGYDKEGYEDAYKEWQELASKNGIPKKKVINDLTVFRTYQSLVGEVEARNAQTRRNMTPEQRRETLLAETEDVAREYQIVLMEGLEAQMALERDSHSNLLFQSAYHGSPYAFDKFSTDYIGEGQGTQSFGWGIYLTQGESIATDYAEGIDKKNYKYMYKGETVVPSMADGLSYAANMLSGNGNSITTARKYLKQKIAAVERMLKTETDEAHLEELKHNEKLFKDALTYLSSKKDWTMTPSRNLYTVTIPDEVDEAEGREVYIKWDAPVGSDMSKIVSDALYDKLIAENPETYDTDASKQALREEIDSEFNTAPYPDGQKLYRSVQRYLGGSQEAASKFLNQWYVGNDYPAGSIWGGGNGKRNFVVFNADDITIDNHLMWQNKTPGEVENEMIAEAKGETLEDWLDFNRFLGDDNLDEEALKAIWEKANNVTETPDGAKIVNTENLTEEEKDNAFQAIIDSEDGVRRVIEDIRQAIQFKNEVYRTGASDEEEQSRAETIDKAQTDLETTAAKIIKSVVFSKEKEIADGAVKSIQGIMRKNLVEYRELYSKFTGREELAMSNDALPFIDEPTRAAVATMTISQKRRYLEEVADEKLTESFLKGKELNEGETERVIAHLKETMAEKDNEIAEARAELSNATKRISSRDQMLLKEVSQRETLESQVNKLSAKIRAKLDKGNKISEEEYRKLNTAQEKLDNINEMLKELRRQDKTKEALKWSEKLDKLKAEQKWNEKRLRAARKLHEYKGKLHDYIMHKVSKNVNWEQAEEIKAIQAAFGTTTGYDTEYITLKGKRMKLAEFREGVKNGTVSIDGLTDYQKNRLFNLSLADYTVEELEYLAEAVRYLTQKGRQEWQAKVDARNYEAKQWQTLMMNQIARSPRYTNASDTPLPGTAEDIKKERNLLQMIRTGWQKTLNMARKAQMLDGDRKAVAYRLLIEEYRDHLRNELENIRRRQKPVKDLMEKLGVKPEDFYNDTYRLSIGGHEWTYNLSQIIYGVKAQMEQRNMEAFVFGNLFNANEKPEGVNRLWLERQGEIRLAEFNRQAQEILKGKENLMKVADAIWADWQNRDNFNRLNQAAIEEYNMAVDPVAFYMPIARLDFNGTELASKIADDLYNQNAGKGMTSVEKGMIQSRITIAPENQMPIDMDYFKLWNESVNDQEHFIETNAYIRKLNRVFKARGSKDLKATIENVFGQGMMNDINNYINEIANPDINTDTQGVNKFITVLRGALYPAYLAFKASSVILQMITSPAPFLREVGPLELVKGLVQMSLHPVETWRYVSGLSAIMENRSMNPMVEEAKKAAQRYTDPKYKRLWHKIQEKGTEGLEMADRWSVTAGWLAVFSKKKDEFIAQGMEEAQAERQAVKYADNVVLETQPTGDKAELAPLFKVGGPAWQAFTQFQVSLNVIWNNLTYDVLFSDRYNHEKRKAIGTLLGYAMAGMILYATQEGFDDDDDAEDVILKLLYGATTQYTSSIPLVSSSIDNMVRARMTGDNWISKSNQLYPGFDALMQGVTNLDWKKVLRGAAIMGGVPMSGYKEFEHAFYNRKTGELRFYPQSFLGRRETKKKK